METGDDVTVRRDDVCAAIRLLCGRGRRPNRVVWILPDPEAGTIALGYGPARYAISAAGSWGTPAEIDAGCLFRLFRHGRLPDSVRLTMFGGTFMVAGTIIAPAWALAASAGQETTSAPQGELFPPAVQRALVPPRRR